MLVINEVDRKMADRNLLSKIYLGNMGAEIVGNFIRNNVQGIFGNAGNTISGLAAGHSAFVGQTYRLVNEFFPNRFGRLVATPYQGYLVIKTTLDGLSGISTILNGDFSGVYDVGSAVAHGLVAYEFARDVKEDYNVDGIFVAYRDWVGEISDTVRNLSEEFGARLGQRNERLEEKI